MGRGGRGVNVLQAGSYRRHKTINGFFARAFAHDANAQHLASQGAKAASHFNLVILAQTGAQGIGVHAFGRNEQVDLGRGPLGHIGLEAQLAHGEKNAIRAAYNHAEYLPERRRMMQEWADYLEGLKANKD